MRQDMYSLVFQYLSMAIYEEVECTVWFYGKKTTMKGKLDKVEAFDYIALNKTRIPFVGDSIAIEEIKKVKNGNVIYTNPQVVNYNMSDTMGIIRAQEEMLGFSVEMEKLEEQLLKRVKA